FEPTTPLGGDTYEFTAAPVDAAGNEGKQTSVWKFELLGTRPEPPSITLVNDDKGSITGRVEKNSVTDDDQLTVSGTSAVGTTVTVYVDGNPHGTAVASDGTWSIEITPALTGDGEKVITATATDGAGQESDPTGDYLIVLDTAAPGKPDVPVAMDNTGDQTGPITNGSTTDESNPKFSGSGEAGAVVRIYDNGDVIGSTTVNTSGNWEWTPSTPLGGGDHLITTTLTDPAGNMSVASDSLGFTVDSTPVEIKIIKALDNTPPIMGELANNDSTDDTTPTLVGTATANATVTIYNGSQAIGSAVSDSSGSWSVEVSAQPEGTHTFTAEALNAAGNKVTADFTLTIDTTAPTAPVIDNVEDDVGSVMGNLAIGATTDDTTPTVYGSGGTVGDTITIYVNDQVYGTTAVSPGGTWIYTFDPALTADGPNVVMATATDAVGNESGKSAPFTFILDTTPPGAINENEIDLVDDVAPKMGTIDNLAININGSPTDDVRPTYTGTADSIASDVVLVNIYHGFEGGTPTYIGSAGVEANGTWSFTPSDDLETGTHSFQAAPVDAAGNEGSKTAAWVFFVDADAPLITAQITQIEDDTGDSDSDFITSDNTLVFTGTVSATISTGQNVEISFNDGADWAKAVVNYNEQTWTYDNTANTPLADGTHTILTRVVSAAGTAGDDTENVIVIDTTAPDDKQSIIESIEDDTSIVGDYITSDPTLKVHGSVYDDAQNPAVTALPNDEWVQLQIVEKDNTGNVILDWANVAMNPARDGWTYDATDTGTLLTLADGTYTFNTHVIDIAGNASVVNSQVVVIDTSLVDPDIYASFTAVIDDELPNPNGLAT
ncbi:Ig-like domain-containing protein, partial [Desulfosarcina sp. OttesenSCG-928-A07]|nr:Ig-like domain-containing protein [Desulfosarcina sp. OttesenSCG-928-A07]